MINGPIPPESRAQRWHIFNTRIFFVKTLDNSDITLISYKGKEKKERKMLFRLQSKAVRYLASLENYEVIIDEDEKFIELKNTNFGMQYYPDCDEWELFTNYSRDGQWKILRKSFNGNYRECLNKIVQLDRYFKSK